MSGAYAAGVDDAQASFGVRTAGELQRRMPDGPGHLGAERLTKLLGQMHEEYNERGPRRRELSAVNKPIRWGPEAPIDDSRGTATLGSFGGV